MSTKIKGKTFSAKVGSSAKSKGASLPPLLDGGGAGNAVKGQDERQTPGALDGVSSAVLPYAFFQIDKGRGRHRQDDKPEMISSKEAIWAGCGNLN